MSEITAWPTGFPVDARQVEPQLGVGAAPGRRRGKAIRAAPMMVIVLALTGVWHTLAAWHFTVHPARTLGRTTRARPIDTIATELFRFLGGLNLALAFLAFAACFVPGARLVAAGVLCLANLSQFLQDVRVGRAGLVRGVMFVQILVGDALFTVANLAAVLVG